MQKTFPLNPTLLAMQYHSINGRLAITFKKGQIRTYNEVPKELAYKLYYKQTASETMAVYSNEIKKKFKVEVTLLK